MAYEQVDILVKTAQLAQWRKVKYPDVFMDITVKSGNKNFAPTWDMLMALRANEMTEEDYRVEYVSIMLVRILTNLDFYREALLQEFDQVHGGAIVMACYCRAGKFCHRHVLIKDVLPRVAKPLGLTFTYLGEVT